MIPAGKLKPLPGEWRTPSSGELRVQLPLPSELLSVASENRTPLRFLVLAWHPQAGWAWGGQLPEGMRQRFRDPMPLPVAPELRIRYHLGTREVRGRLTDSRTGRPLQQEAVLLHTEPGKWFKSIPSDYLTFTDAQGWFTVYLPHYASGPIVPTVCRLPHGAEVWASLSPTGTRPPMQAACERWELGEIAIHAPDGVVAGEVRGANGKPEPFALVVAQGKKPPAPARRQEITCRVTTCNGVRKTLRQQMGTTSSFACTFTDAQGRFRLPVRSGEWQLRAHPTHAPREPAGASMLSLPCQIPFVSTDTRWVTARVSRGQTVAVQLPLSAGGRVRPVRV